jgi:hypothetical protein
MVPDALLVEMLEKKTTDLVVEPPLAGQFLKLLAVESRGVVFVRNPDNLRMIRCENFFGLAFIKQGVFRGFHL